MEATASFAEKAASIDSTSSAAMAEVGRQCLLRGRIKEAQKYYKVGGSSPRCTLCTGFKSSSLPPKNYFLGW